MPSNKKQTKCTSFQQRLDDFQLKQWLKQEAPIFFLLGFIVLVLYIPFINNDFVSDDVFAIVNNPQLGQLSEIIKSPFSFLRPLFYWSTFHLFGRAPWAFRIINIISHLGVVLAAYTLFSLLFGKKAGLTTSVLTVVHPIMAEAVIWISGGAYSQSAFFALLACLFYLLRKKHQKYFWWALISYFISLVFSEKAIGFAPIFFVFDWLYHQKKEWLKSWPFIALSGGWGLIFLLMRGQRAAALATSFSGPARSTNPLLKIPIAINSYLELIFWPNKLALYHSELIFSKTQFFIKASIISILLLVLGIFLYWGKKQAGIYRKISLMGLWFLLGLSITLLPFSTGWIVAERYAYLASMGIFAILGILLQHILYKTKQTGKNLLIGCLVLVGLALGIRTMVRNNDWQTADKLWLAGARTSPNSPQNNNNLGDLYGRRGDFERSIWHFKKAIELNPQYADAYHNLGNAYEKTGKLKKAKANYQNALKFRPQLWQSWQALGSIAYQQGNFDQATEALEKAAQLNPSKQLYLYLAAVYSEAENQDKAQEIIQALFNLPPGDPQINQVLEKIKTQLRAN